MKERKEKREEKDIHIHAQHVARVVAQHLTRRGAAWHRIASHGTECQAEDKGLGGQGETGKNETRRNGMGRDETRRVSTRNM